MGFDVRRGHNRWHFEQFAAYRLLTKTKKVAVTSHKRDSASRPPAASTSPSGTPPGSRRSSG
jgi:hypothetical protein